MSLVDRITAETRTIGGVPWQPWRNPYWKFNIGGPVHPSRQVQGEDNVLSLAAVYSSIRFIADQVSSLPIKVYRRLPDGSSQRLYSSMLLGDEINPGGGPQPPGEDLYSWFFSGTESALLHGTAWGLVTNRSGIPGADGLGLPTGVAWLPADRVSVQQDEQQPENPLRARIYYQGHLMDRSELKIMKAFSVPGRVEGISPLRAFAMLFSQGLRALEYSNTWFENGGFPPGTFQNTGEEVDDAAAKEIRRRLTDAIRLRQPLVYGRDWEYKALTVPQDEATFITSMQLNATQVAAIYGVQPHRVGGNPPSGMKYSNVTQDQLDELQSTLRPWLRRWEHLLTSMLPATQYARFDADELLKTDPKTRNDIYSIQRTMGSRTQNEIRSEDDLPPVEGGNDPIPLSMTERMVATTRTLPKSLLPLVEFEADHIADRVQEIEKEQPELLNPNTAARPPLQATSQQFLARLMTQVRGVDTAATEPTPMFGNPEGRPADSDRKSAITMIKHYESIGKLDSPEAAKRIALAGSVQTLGALAELVQDLPPLHDGEAPSVKRDMFGPGKYRASDSDRAAARKLLAIHGKAGRLREAEVEERSGKAGEAVTCADLATLFSDLPEVDISSPPPEEDRQEPRAPMFGPAALALLHGRALNDEAALAATNGKAH